MFQLHNPVDISHVSIDYSWSVRCRYYLSKTKTCFTDFIKLVSSCNSEEDTVDVVEPIIYKKECFDWVTPSHLSRIY
jgi:hypothetical protein